MVANDVGREGLVVLTPLIGLRECATSLIMDIVTDELDLMIATFMEFFKLVWVWVRPLTMKQVDRVPLINGFLYSHTAHPREVAG